VLGILRGKKAGKRKGPVAVIDIGSNSVRLVVYDGAKRAPLPVFNEKVICGLGRGLEVDGTMSPENIDMALNCLNRFFALTDSLGVRHVQTVATAAVREASNGKAFVDRVQRECGLTVEVVSGGREAELSGYGVLSGIPDAAGIMGDLGGGSVELVGLGDGRLREKATLPLGALRAVRDASVDRVDADHFIDQHLAGLDWLNTFEGQSFYAVGGAWRALARVHMDQARYPIHVIQQYTLSAAEALDFVRFVGHLSRNTLEGVQGLSRQRIDSVPYAARLLERLIQETRVKNLLFCAYGLREGCLYDRLSKRLKMQDPLIAMTQEVAGRAGRSTSDGETLANWTAPVFEGETPAKARLRHAAANLADIGWSEHPDYRAEQVFLRILRMPIVGLTHEERAMLALSVASRHSSLDGIIRRWKIDRLLSPAKMAEARAVGLAMRLAYTLTGGAIGLLGASRLEREGDRLMLLLPAHADILVGDVVERRFRALAKSLNCDYEVLFVDEPSAQAATA
jgi:exopolyphosphatase/guanosine-5'-triphosphate,3'-diphosphate pyrophosphatase